MVESMKPQSLGRTLLTNWTIRMTPKDLLFCSVFVVELLLRIYAYGRRFFSMSLGRTRVGP